MKNSFIIKNRAGFLSEEQGQFWGKYGSNGSGLFDKLIFTSPYSNLFFDAHKVSVAISENQFHNLEDCAIQFEMRNEIKRLWFIHGQQINVSSQEEFDRYLKLRSFE